MTPVERAYLDEQLRALVLQAWEFRGSAYLRDAVDAIVAAHERAALTLLERRLERTGRLVRLLRETDPRRLGGLLDAPLVQTVEVPA